MHELIRVSAVSYLNTRPYLAGFDTQSDDSRYMVTVDTPSVCADKLFKQHADLGLVPVAAISSLRNYREITDYGIGCDGAVESVIIAGQQPIEDLRQLKLDYQSQTSNQLATILIRDYFESDLEIVSSSVGYEDELDHEVGGVIIGDRALRLKRKFKFVYDLGLCWKELTGLPFVFARWMGSPRILPVDEKHLEQLFEKGMQMRPELSGRLADDYSEIDVEHYLTGNIQYDLSDHAYRQGQDLFLEKISASELTV